jgi:polyisoprenoid-binding protein YceI
MKSFYTTTQYALIALAVFAVTAAARAQGTHAIAIDPQHSRMTVYVYKQGIFAFAADNHVVNAPIVSGSYDDTAKSVTISVDATKMMVLDPSMPASRRASVQANMVGSDVLDVAKYPTIKFRSTSIKAGAGGHLTVTGDLTLHGQTHSVTLDVTRSDSTHFTGSTMLRQTAFGITPIRIAGGTIKVKDDVKVEFAIALKAP